MIPSARSCAKRPHTGFPAQRPIMAISTAISVFRHDGCGVICIDTSAIASPPPWRKPMDDRWLFKGDDVVHTDIEPAYSPAP